MKKFYSVRVVEADNVNDAIDKVARGQFLEDDAMCDKVIEAELINIGDFRGRDKYVPIIKVE